MAKKKETVVTTDKQRILKDIKEVTLKVKDISLNELIPNFIDGVIVNITEGRHHLYIPMYINGERLKRWKYDRGGIFSHDVHLNNLGKTNPKYILLQGEDYSIVSRIIEDGELDKFSSLKLIDGKIKDVPIMYLKRIKTGDKLNKIDEYIKENADMNLFPIILSSKYMPSLEHGDNYSSNITTEE